MQEKLTNWSKFRRDHQDDWGLEPCKKRHRWLGLFGLEKKWLCRRQTTVCQLLQGSCQEDGDWLFTVVHGVRTRENWKKKKKKVRGSGWL